MWQKFKEIYLPTSILLSAVLISGTLWYTRNPEKGFEEEANLAAQADTSENQENPPISITENDHVRGNKDAKVLVVIFSDLECPYCKYMHTVMQQAVLEYGDQIRWVHKHFPLDSRHPKARKEAEATECAAELGGNEKFWEYLDTVFERTPSNNGLDLSLLPTIAEDIGLDKAAFQECLNSGRQAEKVQADYTEGMRIGVQGTPAVFVGDEFINGAIPIEELKKIIDAQLTK